MREFMIKVFVDRVLVYSVLMVMMVFIIRVLNMFCSVSRVLDVINKELLFIIVMSSGWLLCFLKVLR